MYNFQSYFPRNYQLTAYFSFLFHVFIPNRYLARINFVIFIFAFTSTALGASFADFEAMPFAPLPLWIRNLICNGHPSRTYLVRWISQLFDTGTSTGNSWKEYYRDVSYVFLGFI